MGRPKGSRNKRTLLKEAEQHVGSKYVDQVLDSLYVIETAMGHFFIRAEMGKNAGRKKEEVDEDYKQAAALAALVAPYRHARLSAVKLAGDPNNPARFKDDATADELRAELMKRIVTLQDAGLIDLKALPPPHGGTANQADVTGQYFYHLKRTEPNTQAQDPGLQDRLIAICAEISGVPLPA